MALARMKQFQLSYISFGFRSRNSPLCPMPLGTYAAIAPQSPEGGFRVLGSWRRGGARLGEVEVGAPASPLQWNSPAARILPCDITQIYVTNDV
jgi:hypothetical protein